MKRITVGLSMLFAILLLISGCNRSVNFTKDENGNTVYESDSLRTVMYDTLPAVLKYNDSEISLINVNIREEYANYVYYLHIQADFDISKLSDSERHWLEDDFSCKAYVSDDDNNIDFTALKEKSTTTDGDTMSVKFTSYGVLSQVRHSFSGCNISIVADCEQEEIVTTDKGYELNKTEEIHFTYSPVFDDEESSATDGKKEN